MRIENIHREDGVGVELRRDDEHPAVDQILGIVIAYRKISSGTWEGLAELRGSP